MGKKGGITQVIKRDNSTVLFNEEKIYNAISKAAKATSQFNNKIVRGLTKKVMAILEKRFQKKVPTVEDIQDAVEEVLIREDHIKVAKAYILYREKHKEIREFRPLFDSIELVDSYIQQIDWMVKENSNMSFSLQGLNNYISAKMISKYWLAKIFNERIRHAHENGELHIHDLGTLGAYCVGWDLKDLLICGFKGVYGKLECKPPKHFRTALGQLVNFFYTLQGEAAGAQAFSNFDTYLAPFIYYDKLNYKQIKQAMQEFIFNMNVPTRVGFQTPFTNISMDLKVPKTLKDENVIIGGKEMAKRYGDFQHEMDLLNQVYAELMMEGDARGRVFTFPIATYNITHDFDWDNEHYQPIWEMTAKYGTAYFSNFINSSLKPEDARSMCCRLRLDNRELKARGGGLFGANPLTGSIGVVTINLPRIGYTSKNEEEFFTKLSTLMDIGKESLEIKRKVLEHFTEGGLYPYSKFYLRNIKKAFGSYWKNHFATIGIVGMHEALLNFMDKGIDTKEGKNFALRVLEFMRERLADYQEETKNIYNLEATPAEGTSYRLARIDKKEFPDIITAGKDEPYYTNSSQLPVSYTDDIFEALENQDELQCMYTGGTVLHGFLGEQISDPEVCKKLIKRIAYNYKLPYFTITPTFSICPVHGYIAGRHESCPHELKEEVMANAKM